MQKFRVRNKALVAATVVFLAFPRAPLSEGVEKSFERARPAIELRAGGRADLKTGAAGSGMQAGMASTSLDSVEIRQIGQAMNESTKSAAEFLMLFGGLMTVFGAVGALFIGRGVRKNSKEAKLGAAQPFTQERLDDYNSAVRFMRAFAEGGVAVVVGAFGLFSQNYFLLVPGFAVGVDSLRRLLKENRYIRRD